jgi:ABC-2 type transport system ATP-binding protein
VLAEVAQTVDRVLIINKGRLADGALLVPGTSAERVGDIAFAAGIPVHELSAETSSLEEIFLQLTSDAEETAG